MLDYQSTKVYPVTSSTCHFQFFRTGAVPHVERKPHIYGKKHISTCTLYLKQNLGNDINMYVQECMLLLKSGHWGSSCLALCCFVIKYVSNTGNRHLSGRSGIATS